MEKFGQLIETNGFETLVQEGSALIDKKDNFGEFEESIKLINNN